MSHEKEKPLSKKEKLGCAVIIPLTLGIGGLGITDIVTTKDNQINGTKVITCSGQQFDTESIFKTTLFSEKSGRPENNLILHLGGKKSLLGYRGTLNIKNDEQGSLVLQIPNTNTLMHLGPTEKMTEELVIIDQNNLTYRNENIVYEVKSKKNNNLIDITVNISCSQ